MTKPKLKFQLTKNNLLQFKILFYNNLKPKTILKPNIWV